MAISFVQQLRQAVLAHSDRPVKRLQGLIEILAEWSHAPAKRDELLAFADTLTPAEVREIKQLIADETHRINLSKKEEITEQLLFNVVGALRNLRKDALDDPWRAAMLNADFLLNHARKSRAPIYLGLAAAIATAGFFAIFIVEEEIHIEHMQIETTEFPGGLHVMTPPAASPYAPEHFLALREKMRQATCQFPQAATLPVEQQQAFLDFLHTGKISWEDLTHLETALAHINCQYMPLSVDSAITGPQPPGD